jgi:hypothetical protein
MPATRTLTPALVGAQNEGVGCTGLVELEIEVGPGYARHGIEPASPSLLQRGQNGAATCEPVRLPQSQPSPFLPPLLLPSSFSISTSCLVKAVATTHFVGLQ